uniref:Ferritin-like domain-containing protein n=1 Tax=Roseihalotalea indica TaxID=2867963 RepID=A0AA49GQA6_9BACT|nr:ferritin-like domain-containing protein [Tunicatimonas sp. TK19036]
MSREKLTSLEDLLVYELKDLYSAETQLLSALPEMSNAATHAQLKDAFDHHLKETKEQQNRLKQIGEMLGTDLKGETCQAMKGLIKEGKEVIGMRGNNDIKDAALIAAAQRVEHYEIAGYGAAYHFAKQLGHQPICDLLQLTLDEEKEANAKLSHLALEGINQDAS